MTFESEFKHITCSRYHDMQKRFLAQYSGTGTLLEPALAVPFTLAQYRDWIERLLGHQAGVTNCVYCNAILDIHTLVIDHRMPPRRGGSMGFDNLAPSCDCCNQQKGFMSADAFLALLELVNDPYRFSPIDRDNVLGRLQSQLKLALREQARLRAASHKRNPIRINPVRQSRDASTAS